MTSNWAQIEAEVSEIIRARPAEYGEYDAATHQNLAELFEFLRKTGRPVPDVGPGWYPTFSISWNLEGYENLEIEVHADKYEVYRFFNGSTELWYEHHSAGGSFSPAFLSELPDPA